MTLSPRLIVVAMAVALFLAGCGGDDGEETTAPATPPPVETTALTKEELVAQGDAICAEVNAAVGALAASESGEATEAASLYSGMVERLQDLGAPSDDAAGYSEFAAAAEGLAQAESDVELAADRGEEEALASAELEASEALSSFQEAAAAYGFEQCAEEPSAVTASGSGDASTEPGAEEEAPEEGEEAPEEASEVEEEVAPETGGAGSAGEGGGAEAGGEAGGGGETGGSSGGIGPG